MGKKMGLIPFLFKPTTDPPPSSASTSQNSTWPWPAACGSPKTLSFRADKIMNSVYVSDSRFTNSTEPNTHIAADDEFVEVEDSGGPESIEQVIRGLKSDRLFFQAGETSSRITGDDNNNKMRPKKNGLEYNNSNSKGNTRVMEVDSSDPLVDFKRSMEEMVEAHGLKDNWEGLQELLGWYLKVNGKSNHGYIVGAFVDLLVALHFVSSTETSSVSSSSCHGDGDGDGGNDIINEGDIESSCSATAMTRSSPISALSFTTTRTSTSYSTTTSNCSTSTPYNCLSSLEEESEESLGNDDYHESCSSAKCSSSSTR